MLTSTPEKKLEEQVRGSAKRLALVELEVSDHEAIASNDEDDLDPVDMEEERQGILSDPMMLSFDVTKVKTGDFLLVNLRGGRRDAHHFRYVAQADEPYDDTDPEWLRVRGYRGLNSAKTQFGPRENDLFTVEIDNIIVKLADPKLLPGRAIANEFIGTADTKEM